LAPAREVAPDELVGLWHREIVEIALAGMGAFADRPSLLNKVRGALGDVLVAAGSDAVRAKRPCDWSPPCAAEVFFADKPALRIGSFASQISKPFVLAAGRRQQELVVRATIFGFATDWTRVVAEALAYALREKVRWHALAKDDGLFVPRTIEIKRLRVSTAQGLRVGPAPREAVVAFVTPLDAERGSLDETPHLVLDRLARRIALLARWYDVALDPLWDDLERAWLACDYEIADEARGASSTGGHKFRNRVTEARSVTISGELAGLWPLLVIGESTHIGRGANVGLGRYRLMASGA